MVLGLCLAGFEDYKLGCSALAAAVLVAVENPESAGLMACFFTGGGCAGTCAASARNRSPANASASPAARLIITDFSLAIGI
jgi:hypothetical protein